MCINYRRLRNTKFDRRLRYKIKNQNKSHIAVDSYFIWCFRIVIYVSCNQWMRTFCILDGPRPRTCSYSIFFLFCFKSKTICSSCICNAIHSNRCFHCGLFKLIPRIINIGEYFNIWIICNRNLFVLWSWIINIWRIFLLRLLTRFSICSRCWRNLGLSHYGNIASYLLIYRM